MAEYTKKSVPLGKPSWNTWDSSESWNMKGDAEKQKMINAGPPDSDMKYFDTTKKKKKDK